MHISEQLQIASSSHWMKRCNRTINIPFHIKNASIESNWDFPFILFVKNANDVAKCVNRPEHFFKVSSSIPVPLKISIIPLSFSNRYKKLIYARTKTLMVKIQTIQGIYRYFYIQGLLLLKHRKEVSFLEVFET